MASTFSTRLRIELIGAGEQDGAWYATANTQLGTIIEEAVAGVASVTHDDSANYTLTTNSGASDEARQMVLTIGGTLTAARNVVVPTSEKIYVVHNNTAGGYAVTVKTDLGTGISIASTQKAWVYCDGTNVEAIGLANAAGGSGSGLDADTLDTYDSAIFTRKAENATVTGDWTFSGTTITFTAAITAAAVTTTKVIVDDANFYFDLSGSNPTWVADTGNDWMRYDRTANSWDFAVAGTEYFSISAAGLTGPAGATVWHSGNDGTGSTLDADTVDGVELTALGQLAVAQTWSAAQRGSITGLTDEASIAIDLALNNFFSVTLGDNRALANPTNIVAGQSGSIKITQDGTGSRTLSYGSYWKFAGATAPVLSTTAAYVDRLDYVVWSTSEIHAVLSKHIG